MNTNKPSGIISADHTKKLSKAANDALWSIAFIGSVIHPGEHRKEQAVTRSDLEYAMRTIVIDSFASNFELIKSCLRNFIDQFTCDHRDHLKSAITKATIEVRRLGHVVAENMHEAVFQYSNDVLLSFDIMDYLGGDGLRDGNPFPGNDPTWQFSHTPISSTERIEATALLNNECYRSIAELSNSHKLICMGRTVTFEFKPEEEQIISAIHLRPKLTCKELAKQLGWENDGAFRSRLSLLQRLGVIGKAGGGYILAA